MSYGDFSASDSLMRDVNDVLDHNILPYWETLKDPAGGFYGRIDGDGALHEDAPRGAVLNARILWTYSALYRRFHRKEHLIMAVHAKDYFVGYFLDHKYGGVYWSLDAQGRRLVDKAQLYAQAFGIYALAEFYMATGDDEALKAAVNIYHIVEKHFSDPVDGGYIEALGRDFEPLEDMRLSEHDVNCQKTMNSHLHLLEGYATLYRVWPDPGLRDRVAALLELLETKIMNPATGHLELYFDRDWTVVPGGVSYGHDIETSWLALECAMAVCGFDTVGRTRAMARRLYAAGLEGLQPDGSLIYEVHTDGTVDTDRHWWVQAESVVGNLWAWKYLAVPEGYGRAVRAWEYISRNIVDRLDGEWWWKCDAEGRPDRAADKAGEWKCPYHNARMCLQVLGIFD